MESIHGIKQSAELKSTTGNEHNWQKITGVEIEFEFLALQTQLFSIPQNYSVGVILAKKGQKKDEEFFNNTADDHFTHFLQGFAKLIELKGWSGYKGGLATKDTYYAHWKHYQFCFHVCTMLTSEEQRKHVGNDKVLIYFHEEPFEPRFRGKVNSVAITVQPLNPGNNHTKYKLGGFQRGSLRWIPQLPEDPVNLDQFKEILFPNIINCEWSVMNSPPRDKMTKKVREGKLQSLIDFYIDKKEIN